MSDLPKVQCRAGEPILDTGPNPTLCHWHHPMGRKTTPGTCEPGRGGPPTRTSPPSPSLSGATGAHPSGAPSEGRTEAAAPRVHWPPGAGASALLSTKPRTLAASFRPGPAGCRHTVSHRSESSPGRLPAWASAAPSWLRGLGQVLRLPASVSPSVKWGEASLSAGGRHWTGSTQRWVRTPAGRRRPGLCVPGPGLALWRLFGGKSSGPLRREHVNVSSWRV